jgi:uncharacterized membrane protein YedE/YeeE
VVTEFTPIAALVGGALIGLSAALLMLLNGRIAGISSVLGDLLAPGASYADWRIAFLGGLIAAPLLYAIVGLAGGFTLPIPFMPRWSAVVAAGLLVAFGVRLGGGCTRGHGVCGPARLSRRSIAATAIFVATAAAVVFAMRHGGG